MQPQNCETSLCWFNMSMNWGSVPMLLQVLIVCIVCLFFVLGYRAGDKL